jgi:hypothetical protein
MRKILILAIIILPVIVLLTLPVRAVLPLFDLPDGLGQVQGTLWSGQANWNQPGHPPLQVAWRWSGGRDWLVEVTDPGTHLEGRLRPGGALHLVDLSGRVELDRVDLAHWFRNTRPTGHLEVDLDEAYLEPGEIPRLRGQVIWADARLEGGVHEHLGRVAIELEPGSEHQLARLRSMDTAAVILRGEVRADEHEYRADLWLRASPDRPDLTRQLAGLGELQPDGQVRIELRGRLGW